MKTLQLSEILDWLKDQPKEAKFDIHSRTCWVTAQIGKQLFPNAKHLVSGWSQTYNLEDSCEKYFKIDEEYEVAMYNLVVIDQGMDGEEEEGGFYFAEEIIECIEDYLNSKK